MEKVLNQEEIDQLFRAAQGGAQQGAAAKIPVVRDCDFHQSGQLTKDQVRQIMMLHEAFAPSLANSLGAYLRVAFQIRLVSVEQIPYGDLLGRFPEQTFFAAINVQPVEEMAGLQLDLSVVFPMIDLLLGGPGQGIKESRDLTEIEEQILESIVLLLCRELQNTWAQVLPLEFQIGQRLKQSQILGLMQPADRALNFSFEIQLTDTQGAFNLIFPVTISNMLLRKLAQQGVARRRKHSPDDSARLRESLLDSMFTLELTLTQVSVRIGDIVDLKPGQILGLRHPVREPMGVALNGREVFRGTPVSCNRLRGGLIQSELPPPAVADKEGP
jgi:flagellar motor switch protein FliM